MKLNIEGNIVNVDDSFANLSADEQQQTVEHIAKSLGANTNAPKNDFDTLHQLREQHPIASVIPATIGGAVGSTIKDVGALGELISGEGSTFNNYAKQATQFGETVSNASNELNPLNKFNILGLPVGKTISEIGSAVIPYTGALKGVRAVSRGAKAYEALKAGESVAGALSKAPATTLGRAAEAATAGALTGAATTPGTTQDRAMSAIGGALMGAGGETILPGVGNIAKGILERGRGNYRVPLNQLPAEAQGGVANLGRDTSILPGQAMRQLGNDIYNTVANPQALAKNAMGQIGGMMGGKVAGPVGYQAGKAFGQTAADTMMPNAGQVSTFNPLRTTSDAFQSNRLQGILGNDYEHNPYNNAFNKLFEQEGLTPPSQNFSGLSNMLTGQQKGPATPTQPVSPANTSFGQQLHEMNPSLAPKPAEQSSMPNNSVPALGWNGQAQAKPPMYVSPGGVASPDLEMANKAAFNERTGINQYPEATNPGTQNIPGSGPISPSQPAPVSQAPTVPVEPVVEPATSQIVQKPATTPLTPDEKAAKAQEMLDIIRARGTKGKTAGQQIIPPGELSGTAELNPSPTVPQTATQPVAPEPDIDLEKPTPLVASMMNEPKPEPKYRRDSSGYSYEQVPQPTKGMMALREALEGKYAGSGNESPQLELLREKLAKDFTPDEIDEIASQGITEPVKPTVMRTPEEWKELQRKALFDDSEDKFDLSLAKLKQSRYEAYIKAQEEAQQKARELLKKTPEEKAKWQAERDAEVKAQQEADEKALQATVNRSQAQKVRKQNEYAIKDAVKSNVTTKDSKVIVKNRDHFDELAKQNGNKIDWADMPELTNKSIKSLADQRREMRQWLYGQIKQGKGNLTAEEKLSLFND